MCVEYLALCQRSRLLLTFMIYVHWAFDRILRFIKGGKVSIPCVSTLFLLLPRFIPPGRKKKGFFFLYLKFSKRSPDKTFKRNYLEARAYPFQERSDWHCKNPFHP